LAGNLTEPFHADFHQPENYFLKSSPFISAKAPPIAHTREYTNKYSKFLISPYNIGYKALQIETI